MSSHHRIALLGKGADAVAVALRLVQAGHHGFAAFDRPSDAAAGALPFESIATAVTEARWDPHAQRWALATPRGRCTAEILIMTGLDCAIDERVRSILGRDGSALELAWLRQTKPHRGSTFVGFPNLFIVPGPKLAGDAESPSGRLNDAIAFVLAALAHLGATDAAALEPREQAMARRPKRWPPALEAVHALTSRARAFNPSEYVLEERRNARVRLPVKSRLEGFAGRCLTSLPANVLAPTPIVRDGFTLEPELQAILAVRKLTGSPGLTEVSVIESRTRLRRDAVTGAGPVVPVATVRDLAINEHVRARHYAPAARPGAPLVVFYHGGGFVLGDLESHDAPCRMLCREAGVHVLSIDYRLAPEHPHPAAVLDGVDAYAWACAHARELGADPSRIALAGDSAGGNLAAVVAQEARRRNLPRPSLQVLLYPTIDRTRPFPSVERFGEGFFLEAADMEWFSRKYRAEAYGTPDVTADPGLEKDLADLPPALIVTAGFDPLRDEAEDYASRLLAAGVPTTLRRFEGLVHGFIHMLAVSRACRAAVVSVASDLRAALDVVD
jgi:acetyl esterase